MRNPQPTKPARHRTGRTRENTEVGRKAVSITPPAYGVDFADQASLATVPPPASVQLQATPEKDEKLLQGKTAGVAGTMQLETGGEDAQNHTGMPDPLRTGLEHLSGFDMSDVRVHYNSSKPEQVNALAYTQGREIHVGPGQERHLPHEAWHVVQQMQGRVKPTIQTKGVSINDDDGLEREADVMGEKATETSASVRPVSHGSSLDMNVVQRWEVRFRSSETWVSTWATDTLETLPIEALQKIVDGDFDVTAQMKSIDSDQVVFAGRDVNPEFLIDHAKFVLSKKLKSQSEDRPGTSSGPSPEELDLLEAALGQPKSPDKTIEQIRSESSGVTLKGTDDEGKDVEVLLDNDQLKHQPTTDPIGTRVTASGNTFKPPTYGSKSWHTSNTLVHMLDWAKSLGAMSEGQKVYHGQTRAVNEIHYEGFCQFVDDKKFVLFHCYPAHGSSMKL